MLSSLHIENYALIKETNIDFEPGFAVITGETGSGKSILLGALGMLLGARADSQVLFDKSKKCCVEAVFDIAGQQLQPFFEQNDIDYDPQLIIRREILPSAKSRAFINDTPAPLALLKELASQLIDIHSQHQTLLLNESGFRINLIDSTIAQLPEGAVIEQYRSAYHDYIERKRQLEQLSLKNNQSHKESDYIEFLFNELSNAHLVAGEQSALEEEAQLLSNAEGIKQTVGTIAALCDNDETGAVALLNSARSQLGKIASCHKEIAQLDERMQSCLIEFRDILSELSAFNDQIDYAPGRQQEVEERLDTIYRLEKKHDVDTIEQLLAIQADLDSQLQSFSTLDESIRQAMEAVDQSYAKMQALAQQLSHLRQRAAKELEKMIVPILKDLGMKDATIEINVVAEPEYHPSGCDTVQILFNANKGSERRELSKVASGGEMSRIMLALKSIIAAHTLMPTIIFDEIDTGISGDISVKTGRILRQMSEKMQVIAISHMPQIAALAAQHLKVYKSTDDGRTVSCIRTLDANDRINEIAMMLSSENPTPAARQTAKELLNMQ